VNLGKNAPAPLGTNPVRAVLSGRAGIGFRRLSWRLQVPSRMHLTKVMPMPDWVHAIFMLVIWIALVYLFMVFSQGFLGIILGVSAGYLIAGQIVQRIPGFWGDQEIQNRGDKRR